MWPSLQLKWYKGDIFFSIVNSIQSIVGLVLLFSDHLFTSVLFISGRMLAVSIFHLYQNNQSPLTPPQLILTMALSPLTMTQFGVYTYPSSANSPSFPLYLLCSVHSKFFPSNMLIVLCFALSFNDVVLTLSPCTYITLPLCIWIIIPYYRRHFLP